MSVYILSTSIFLQFSAAALSLYLIKVTGQWRAWILIAIALFLMAIRRTVSLHQMVFSDVSIPVNLTAELIALCISILMVTGILLINPIFKKIQFNNQRLEKEDNELRKSNRIQAMISQCNNALLYEKDEQLLLNRICRIIVETGNYMMSGVGFLLDDERKSVNMEASHGDDNGYLEAANIILTDEQRGNGPVGIAIRTRQTFITRSIETEPCFEPWREAALSRGFASCAAIPLINNQAVIGVLLVYSSETDSFNNDEMILLERLGENLSFGISVLRLQELRKQSENRFKLLVDNSPSCIHQIDLDGNLISMNRTGLLTMNIDQESKIRGKSYISFVCHDDKHKVNAMLEQAYTGNTSKFEFKGTNGRLYKSSFIPISDDNDHIITVMGITNDITEQKQAEEEVHKLSLSVKYSPNIVMITDKNSNIEYVNPKFTEITGYLSEEAIGRKPNYFIIDEISDASYREARHVIEAGGTWHGEFMSRKKNGEHFLSSQIVFPILEESGALKNIVSIQQDITEEKKLEELLTFQASHDALTMLVNRHEFEKRTDRLLKSIYSSKSEHALCFIDLDQFKVVNDTCGHAAGDELLRQLSSVLLNKLRNRDTLARLGGDEFGILMEHCNLDDAYRIAKSLHEATQGFQFDWEGHFFKIGLSIGLVAITKETNNVSQLLKDADAACYQAKEDGRNRIHIFHPDDNKLVKRHGEMQWIEKIYHALENNSFCLYSQSIESLKNNTNAHYELLVRMIDEKGEAIKPEPFLLAAERYDIASKIDYWVIRNTLEILENNNHKINNFNFFSINLSGQSITDTKFLNYVVTQLDILNIPCEKICFEITETAVISNLNTAINFISTLKDMGCRFALDDFGSGLSSFAYLKNLPVNYLKIDGTFIKDISDNPVNHAMVKSISEISNVMGIQTIAEFVEDKLTKSMLHEIGIDYAQGYYIDKPAPFKELFNQPSYNNVVSIPLKK